MATLTLKERMQQLQKSRPEIQAKITEACKNATIRAVEKAAEMTPHTQGDLRGTNTRSGEMKQHWATDSKVNPIGGALSGGKEFHTVLANNKEYASYVNDGHRMDRHFVPGLYINPGSGMLEYDSDYAAGGGGIVVGTKTSYVPGIHMVDAAKKVYQDTLKSELEEIGEVFK